MIYIEPLTATIQRALPLVYTDDLSYLELLAKVISKVNELTAATNVFINQDLQAIVDTTLTGWISDGTLVNILSAAHQADLDAFEADLTTLQGEVAADRAAAALQGVSIMAEPYNALANGLDQSVAIQAAITAATAAGKPVFIPPYEFVCSGLTLPAGAVILGVPGQSRLKTTTDASVLTAAGDNITLDGIKIVGSGKDSGKTAQNGFLVDHFVGFSVRNCKALNLGGSFVLAKNTHSYYYAMGLIADCQIVACNIGINLDESGEYVTVNNCHVSYGNTGIRVLGGNNVLTGCSITQNAVGIYVGTGANDGHGLATGCQFNHNTKNIFAEYTEHGFNFTGCNIMVGDIHLKGCTGIIIDSCRLITVDIKEEGCVGCRMRFCHDLDASVTRQPNFNAVPSQMFYENNSFDNGTYGNNRMNTLHGGSVSGAIPGDVAVGIGATEVLKFSDDTNWISNNAAYSLHDFYSAVTGEFTNYGFGSNKPHFAIKFEVAAAAADGLTARIKVGAQIRTFIIGQVHTGLVRFAFNGMIPCSPANKITIELVNNTAAIVTLKAANSYLFVEGL